MPGLISTGHANARSRHLHLQQSCNLYDNQNLPANQIFREKGGHTE